MAVTQQAVNMTSMIYGSTSDLQTQERMLLD
jgi:hypothetical protein